jgi:aminoglycoside phosphotransferase (APT) family kinase protein
MAKDKMHADEAEIDGGLVRRLVAGQFPHWADLPVRRFRSSGTANAIFRLGAGLAVRLPRIESAVGALELERDWLPTLAAHLPLTIPEPVATGRPGSGYPWNWSIYRWIEGHTAVVERVAHPHQAASDLGRFVAALQKVDPAGAPTPGSHNSFRGVPLAQRDAPTRHAIAALRETIDTDAATAAWEAALRAPVWNGPATWFHGDLLAANLLAVEGRLHAVIDFGCMGVGDPACDMMPAWTYLSPETRNVFRSELAVDDATWARGRGWALSFGLIALPYYQVTNPVLAATARFSIDAVISDQMLAT